MAKKVKKIENKKKKVAKKSTVVSGEGIKRTRIRVIGIGGGGCSIVSEIASKMKKATFVAANTDLQALRTAGRNVIRFPFGQKLTSGLGTGMNVEVGRQAALDEKEKIKKLLEGQDLCVIIACLGGGTGSGAVSTFAKISKDLGNITYGILTLPFKFEGEKKVEIAREALKKAKIHFNALSVIPNERVFQIIDKTTPLKQALSTINKNLAESLGGLIETIYEPGLINIDFADFRTVLDGHGKLAYLDTAEMPKKGGSAKDLIAKVLSSPLYPYNIKGAKGVLFNIVGEKDLSLVDVNQISNTISSMVSPDAKIIFGISQNKRNSNTVKTILLATGCGMKISSEEKKKRKPKKKKVVQVEVEPQPELRKKPTQPSPRLRRAKKKIVKKVVKKKAVEKKPQPKAGTPRAEEPEVKQVEAPLDTQRKTGLQLKEEAENVEKEMLEKERFWETPAFLRRKNDKA